MMLKTHVAIGAFFALLFLNHINNKLLFIPVVLIASMLPDIDMSHSFLGQNKILRPVQWVVKHRGIFHSLTFCLIVCLIFAMLCPVLALPFFVGYAGHLLTDSFTIHSIKPFWPLKKEISGPIKTNGNIEKGIFFAFLFVDAVLLLGWIAKVF
jgi:membrane-bound metal-dependent hydrolase YbcI (DUF457 family)